MTDGRLLRAHVHDGPSLMRLLVTGGAGFQGRHLVAKWIEAGHDVTTLNTFSEASERAVAAWDFRPRVVWGSVTDKEVVLKTIRDQDVVIHLAARVSVDESIVSPYDVLAVNVMGTLNVLEAVRATGARLIYASSCEVYGYAASVLSEESPLRPHSPYAASKAGADRLCYAYHSTFGVDVIVLRPCNVYGAGQKAESGGAVIPTFVNRALAGQPIKVSGDGSQRREYMHVDDLVAAYDLFLNSTNPGAIFNVGTGETVAIRDIAEIVSQRLGNKVEYQPPRPGEVEGFMLDSSRARANGFESTVRFKDGLADYIEWRISEAGGVGRRE
jgi:dTDP-glucose 4,6-dehydratase